MKKELLLFCTSNYFRVNNDLIHNKYNLFDKVKLLSEYDLDDNIKNIINTIINKYGIRGYGYWIWKPYLILQELNNLRLKPTGVQNQFKVERISRSLEKDRFSALEYGLYRIKFYEDSTRNKITSTTLSKFNFYTHKTRKRGR